MMTSDHSNCIIWKKKSNLTLWGSYTVFPQKSKINIFFHFWGREVGDWFWDFFFHFKSILCNLFICVSGESHFVHTYFCKVLVWRIFLSRERIFIISVSSHAYFGFNVEDYNWCNIMSDTADTSPPQNNVQKTIFKARLRHGFLLSLYIFWGRNLL